MGGYLDPQRQRNKEQIHGEWGHRGKDITQKDEDLHSLTHTRVRAHAGATDG